MVKAIFYWTYHHACNDGSAIVGVDYDGVDDAPKKSEGGSYEGEGAPLHYRKPAPKSALVRIFLERNYFTCNAGQMRLCE